ncbi:YceI family protein [Halovulum sp. GXIMD14793]
MTRPALSAALLAATLAPVTLPAAPWVVDKSHAAITFEVEHFGYSNVPAQFRSFEAKIDFDPENIEATKASISIDATSFDSNFAARDEHVIGPDFLDTAAHPTIEFVSTSVTATGDDTAKVTGNLTLRGVTKEVTFDATLNKLAPGPFPPNADVAGFTINGSIDRTEFGLDTYAPAIGVVIPVTIHLEMSPE